MAKYGFSAADFDDDVVEVMPCNWLAVDLFGMLSGQWREGAGGIYALDYSSVFSLMNAFGFNRKKKKRLFEDILVMEQAALDVMRE